MFHSSIRSEWNEFRRRADERLTCGRAGASERAGNTFPHFPIFANSAK